MKEFVPTFSDHRRLSIRLADAISKQQSLSFLVGSAFTTSAGSPPRRGVPSVNGIIDRIRQRFTRPDEIALFEEDVGGGLPAADRYQRAMQLLLDCRGPEEMNRVVREAVLEARADSSTTSTFSEDLCKRLEADVSGWSLSPAVEALGQLLTRHPRTFPGPILTTNFDPLIEIATTRAGGRSEAIFLSSDGRFDNVHGRDVSHVVHLHGYWLGTDTLHTPQQLTRERPRLKGCLREFLRDTTLVVMGYGGWDDVLTRTLFEAVSEGSERLNILWCFYADSETVIRHENANLLKAIEQLTGQRIILYKGIDCHAFLPQLAKRTNDYARSIRPIPVSTDSTHGEPIRIELSGMPPQTIASFSCDPPPVTDVWVGRERELSVLRRPSVKVCTITAIGGQGKSALAAKLTKEVEQDPSCGFELWDWRDCREHGDQIHTKILSIIERLSGGNIKATHLAGEPIDSVVQTLFTHLGNRRILFVFDNIDHYVDLENAYPALGMKPLFDMALTANHRSKFIFTCRPAIHVEDHGAVSVSLEGFSYAETEELFKRHGADFSRPWMSELIAKAYDLTAGHTLWLNLIALQAARKPDSVADLLTRIRRRKDAGLPDQTLYSIWSALDEDHQLVLRTMAEIIRPETEANLSTFVPGSIHFKHLQKVLKNLRMLGLLVVARLESQSKRTPVDAYDLHPLVRQFIRETSPLRQRVGFIQPIILYYDKLIRQFRELLLRTPSMSILENWTHKVELEVNSGAHARALDTLDEVRKPLLVAGYYEEYVRVASRLFEEMNWQEAMGRNVTRFDDVFCAFAKCMIELGRTEDADDYLDRYGAISSKNASYVGYCSLRCYAYWYRGDYNAAIDWGTRGRDIIATTKVDTDHSCNNNLALAHRDGGFVDLALMYFLGQERLEKVLDTRILPDDDASHYGNIGRCLWLKADTDRALICYRKSALLLEREESPQTIINQGYARLWIGEALTSRGDIELGYCFLRSAIMRWRRVAPPRATNAESKIAELRGRLQPFEAFASLSEDEVERRCRRWLYG